MQIERIDHIVLKVASITRTCAFYQKHLGMEVVDLVNGRKALKFGQLKINLFETGNAPKLPEANVKEWNTNICFITSTPIQLVKVQLEKNGIQIIQGIVPKVGALGTIHSIYFQDPDNNLIEASNYH